jgi:uncharacterized protein YdaU (DUF1376 family)
MNGLPYYRRYPRDFIEGTIGMPFETKAAYGLLLDLIYMQDGSLPDDAGYISGLLGCSVRKWNSLRSELIRLGKISADLGIISNFRARAELERTRSFLDKQAENGAKPRKIKAIEKPSLEPKLNHSNTNTYKKEAREARKVELVNSQKAEPNGYPWSPGLSFGENQTRAALWQWAKTRARPPTVTGPIASHHMREMAKLLTPAELQWLKLQEPEKMEIAS